MILRDEDVKKILPEGVGSRYRMGGGIYGP
jgi:hypothetical protein